MQGMDIMAKFHTRTVQYIATTVHTVYWYSELQVLVNIRLQSEFSQHLYTGIWEFLKMNSIYGILTQILGLCFIPSFKKN